jgi:hypothetical protein
VVQQPLLQLRTVLTWQKQCMAPPLLSWTLRPTEKATCRKLYELREYACGEYERLPQYAAEDKGFCEFPPFWDTMGCAHVAALEDWLTREPWPLYNRSNRG